jgi:hypothetical protein
VGTQVDILVGVHRIVEVRRTQYVVSVQTFARRLDFSPQFIPLSPKTRRRFLDFVMPVLFACGVIVAVWLVLR